MVTTTLASPPAQDDKLLGADKYLHAYQALSSDTLLSRSIDFSHPSILREVIDRYPHLWQGDDTTIFNPTLQHHYETQSFDNLYEHLRYLQLEFIAQSELSFYHTLLIVLLRRGYQTPITFGLFEALWQAHASVLFEQLSLRWLVSAADTFIDYSDSPVRRAILLNVVSLINTLKVYETTQFLLTDNPKPDATKAKMLYAEHKGLYDGLTFFRLGSDDSLAQMKTRYQSFASQDAFATEFLLTIFRRLHDNPTAFALIKDYHNPAWAYWV